MDILNAFSMIYTNHVSTEPPFPRTKLSPANMHNVSSVSPVKKSEPANITTDDAIWRSALRPWIMEMEGSLGNLLSNELP